MRRWIAAAAAATGCLWVATAGAIAPERVIEVRRPTAVQLSPDGSWLAFVLEEPNIQANTSNASLYLCRLHQCRTLSQPVLSGSPDFQPSGVRWSPMGQRLAVIGSGAAKDLVRIFDVRTRKQLTVKSGNTIGQPTGANIEWTPDERRLIYLQTIQSPRPHLLGGVSVGTDYYADLMPEELTNSPTVLVMHDWRNGRQRRLTDPRMSVRSFDLAPDGEQIAFAAAETKNQRRASVHDDLYTVRLDNGDVRELLVQPGEDDRPVWSADGSRIAYFTQGGQLEYRQRTYPAFLDAASDRRVMPSEYFDRTATYSWKPLAWNTSNSIVIESIVGLSTRLLQVSSDTAEVTELTPGDLVDYTQFNTAAGVSVLVRQSPANAPEIFVRTASGALEQLTDLNPDLHLGDRIDVREVTWQAPGKDFAISALLGSLKDPPSSSPKPLVVFLKGGPQAINSPFGFSEHYPLLSWIEQGYAVLVPNTRGREGSGATMFNTMRADADFLHGPAQDVIAGVQSLIDQGIADPDRVSLLGFSYGCTLGSYVLTQTRLFKTASLADCPLDLEDTAQASAGDAEWSVFLQQMYGFSDFFDPAQRRIFDTQSSLLHAADVSSAVLLEYGGGEGRGVIRHHGVRFFQALRRHGKTAELVIYPRTQHGITEPAVLLDSHLRNLNWVERSE